MRVMKCCNREFELVGEANNARKVNGLINVDVDLAPLRVSEGSIATFNALFTLTLPRRTSTRASHFRSFGICAGRPVQSLARAFAQYSSCSTLIFRASLYLQVAHERKHTHIYRGDTDAERKAQMVSILVKGL